MNSSSGRSNQPGRAAPRFPSQPVKLHNDNCCRKLEFFREGGSDKHLRDIRTMLAVSGDLINRPELEEWIRTYKLEAHWSKVNG